MLCVINVESIFSEALFGDDDVGKENEWWVVAPPPPKGHSSAVAAFQYLLYHV